MWNIEVAQGMKWSVTSLGSQESVPRAPEVDFEQGLRVQQDSGGKKYRKNKRMGIIWQGGWRESPHTPSVCSQMQLGVV